MNCPALSPIMATWIGKEELVALDRQYHRPRLRFRHEQFASYSYVPPPPDDLPEYYEVIISY